MSEPDPWSPRLTPRERKGYLLALAAMAVLAWIFFVRPGLELRRLSYKATHTPVGPAWFETLRQIRELTPHPEYCVGSMERSWITGERSLCAKRALTRDPDDPAAALLAMLNSADSKDFLSAVFAFDEMAAHSRVEMDALLEQARPGLQAIVQKRGWQPGLLATGALKRFLNEAPRRKPPP